MLRYSREQNSDDLDFDVLFFFAGAIPSLAKLTKLQNLALSSNEFTVFPLEVVELTSLEILELHNNNLAGSYRYTSWFIPESVYFLC